MGESAYCSTSSPTLRVVSFLNFGHLKRGEVIIHCFNFYFPGYISYRTYGTSFQMLIFHLPIFFDEVFVQLFDHFYNQVVFLLLSFKSCLYILDDSPL